MKAGGTMNELMRQATRMQRKMDKAREALRDHEMSADTAGGRVHVTVTCEGKVRQIEVDDAFLAEEGLELVLDSIVAATNKALEAADQHVDSEMAKVTKGVKVPGLTK
jgi:DNA-binding YbaB/EbfC family protein